MEIAISCTLFVVLMSSLNGVAGAGESSSDPPKRVVHTACPNRCGAPSAGVQSSSREQRGDTHGTTSFAVTPRRAAAVCRSVDGRHRSRPKAPAQGHDEECMGL